jgi:hypothetical protein
MLRLSQQKNVLPTYLYKKLQNKKFKKETNCVFICVYACLCHKTYKWVVNLLK